MAARGRDERDGERGQILVMMVVGLLAFCAVVSVVADLGFFFDYRRRMQTGADAAAMAGAKQLRRDLMVETPQLAAAAHNGAASNGFTHLVDGTHVTVNHPPLGGFYAGNNAFVEAIISQPRPTIFMGILGFQSATVSTRAVAGIMDSRNCIYALNATAPAAVQLSGGVQVNANCGVVDDSNNGDALDENGGACMTVTSTAVTGNYTGTCYTPTPKTNVPREPDPLAGLAAPTFSSTCNYTNYQIKTAGTYTLQPGTYCGDSLNPAIAISGTGVVVTFQPGLYVLYGGGLTMSGGVINGTGVTFYNAAGAGTGHPYGPVSINGSVSGALSAPRSGSMEAMLFFQDRAISSTSGDSTVNGSSTLALEGTLYFPTTRLKFAGGQSIAGAAAYTILIADRIWFTGTSSLNDDFKNLPGGSPITTVALAE